MSSVALQGVVSGGLPEVQGVLKLVRLQHRHITYIPCCKIVLMFYNVPAKRCWAFSPIAVLAFVSGWLCFFHL
jgi:hypothetical protein